MSDIEFACTQCHHGLVVDDQAVGGSVSCPHCGQSLTVPDVREGILPGAGAPGRVVLQQSLRELDADIERLAPILTHLTDSLETLYQSASRQTRELESLGHQGSHVREKAEAILQQVQRNRFHVNTVTGEWSGASERSQGGESQDVHRPPSTALWKGLTFTFAGLAILSVLTVGWVSRLGQPRHAHPQLLDVRQPARTVHPPATVNNSRAQLTLETTALLVQGSEKVLLRVLVHNPSLTQPLWLRDLVRDVQVVGPEGRILSCRPDYTYSGESLAPGEEFSIRFWVPVADAEVATRVVWMPGLWAESPKDSTRKQMVFDAPMDVILASGS